jgi:hypothetical protein
MPGGKAPGAERGSELSLDGIPAEVELSRLRGLDNCCIIEGERRTLRVGTRASADYAEYDTAGTLLAGGPLPVLPPAQTSLEGLFREQLVQFDRTISGAASQLATFEDGVATVRLLLACHTARRGRGGEGLPRPWESPRPAPRCPGARVAVTGATGFIGSNVVERLLRGPEGTDVVAVARSLPKLTRLSHLLDHTRLRYAHADIRDRRSLVDVFRAAMWWSTRSMATPVIRHTDGRSLSMAPRRSLRRSPGRGYAGWSISAPWPCMRRPVSRSSTSDARCGRWSRGICPTASRSWRPSGW